ncbi:L-aspartate oxidase [Oecophyllibacter saccharovorans]|uniref:L-aspartate oxidase n=1 Tax=Oecophyllibacter saccharovorans TaxID=2558360 RepID=UPI001142DA31|nr:L-aspartate oxidase [Oecophyllibacter saccharovorans]QDH15612.1 L-aspartate oxidase [Oecophyllibacter saccharovorans]
MARSPTSADDLASLAGLPVIVGAGIAGLSTALHLNAPCVLVSNAPLGTGGSSPLAQGGLSAAIGPADSPAEHARDTLQAGVGLCDERVVQAMTEAGPQTVAQLLAWGVPLAHDGNGQLALHLEAAHSQPRVVFAGGDASGRLMTEALAQQVQARPDIHVLTPACARRIVVRGGQVRGVELELAGGTQLLPTTQLVIATGGLGGLYEGATVPAAQKGGGLAMAARAGAALADMEFTQFHPTALDTGQPGQRPLISEAVRGAGALLVDETGARFTEELAPRDVVTRALAAHLAAGHQVFLDGRNLRGGRFSELFPGIHATCLQHGWDADRQPIPVRPAMHYHMGGIGVDRQCRSTLPGLYAVGEAACTGLHGANRLASNSLLEACVTGRWAAEAILQSRAGQDSPWPASPVAQVEPQEIPTPTPDTAALTAGELMWRHAGINRTRAGLQAVLATLGPRAAHDDAALMGSFVAAAALMRRESRGAHARLDHPRTLPAAQAPRRSLTLAGLEAFISRSSPFKDSA